MNPNEKFALAVFGIAGDVAGVQLTKGPGQIDWGAVGALEQRASGGERALLDLAVEAWGARGGICKVLGRVDAARRAQVVGALVASYEPDWEGL